MPLTDAACRAAKPGPTLRKLSDMGGLQLWVTTTGSRLWRLAYRFGGKQKLLAVGVYPQVSLLQARGARDKAKAALSEGRDPAAAKKLARLLGAAAAGNTFQAVADEYVAKLVREGRAATTITKIEWLLSFARPALGVLPVDTIRSIEILGVLRAVEARGRFETARRLRSTIGSIMRYAVATARAETDPTVALQGALTTPIVKPRAAIVEPAAVGALLRAIDDFDGQPTTQAALKLMALLFPRPGELRAAQWSEFDFQAAIWTVPAVRTKMRRPHRVPLPRQALDVLASLRKFTGTGALVFPSVRSVRRPISENTLNAALRRLGYTKDQATAHGFRATASTLLNESGKWSADAIERQLGHIEGNDVRRAYARGDHWDERVKMLAWWAGYLDRLRDGGTVAPLAKRVA
jgi:integrase